MVSSGLQLWSRARRRQTPVCVPQPAFGANRPLLGNGSLRSLLLVVASIAYVQQAALAQLPSSPPLVHAAELGDITTLRLRLAAGADVEQRDDAGRTALLAATQANQIAAAAILISAGADVNATDNIGDSAFLYAGAEGRTEILRLTLAAGADLASLNRFGGTALIPAAHHGHVEAVRLLLATPIAVDHVNNLGWTALLEAVILGNGGPAHVEIVRLLLAAGADASLTDRDGRSPLVHARARGFEAIADAIAKAGGK